MIAALIFVVSVAAFLQFFISYCHALLASAGAVEISGPLRDLARSTGSAAAGVDVERVMGLARLCPDLGHKADPAGAINVYFRLLCFTERFARPTMPFATGWIEAECKSWAHFAAIALDRRISSNRALIAQELGAAL